MDTLLLDTVLWDLTVDAAGNIARATEPYALAQDVSSAVRLFLGELWYDDTQGIDYKRKILGESPPLAVFQEYMVQAALTVPDVVSAVCIVEATTLQHVMSRVNYSL
jgi:hypothetical protein